MEELKSKIVTLNSAKDHYASKKLKGEATEADNKELISTLIYSIAECRRVASDIGISDDGKINRNEESITIFKLLNQNIKDLKTQIVLLTTSSVEELRALRKEHSDKQFIETKQKKDNEKSKGKDEKTRQNEMRDHLRESLLHKESAKETIKESESE